MRREQVHLVLDLFLDMGQKLIARPVPPEVKEHFHAAHKEVLLGVRALVDSAIERMDAAPTPPSSPPGPTAIKIEAE
ncbi:MAG: hypothetical protein K0R39_3574 [Symbiobacteriaceae bacterium]|jgi:hypothetical protein|nr:hypothetical protein [Symbiobacteriaceae bacterium]